jgi:hypothetical protein
MLAFYSEELLVPCPTPSQRPPLDDIHLKDIWFLNRVWYMTANIK